MSTDNSRYINAATTSSHNENALSNGINLQQARHPDYRDRSQRLFSYTRWTFSHIQDPTKLANYGFFYTEQGDLVRCYYCSLGLKDFIQTDDPLLEHVRYSGEKCGFLVQLLGPTRLSEIKKSIATGTTYLQENTTATTSQLNTVTRETTGRATPQTRTPTQPKVFSTHRHPEYISYSVRLSSYSGWPVHLVQTPQKLSAAGFFYTGTRDVVRCFSCDGGLQRWDPTDDPWIEHCINFPHCLFLIETKGEDYIKLAISHKNQPKAFVVPSSSNPHNISRELQNLQIGEVPRKGSQTERLKVIETLSEMGYKHAEIEPAIQALSKNKSEITVDTTIDEIEQSRSQETKTETCKPKDVLEEHKQLRLQLFCMNCKTADINSLFLPCQHHRFCTACAEDLTICPLCGKGIAHKIKTYRP